MLKTFMGEDTPEIRARFLATIPIGRFSTPEDLGNAACFLCSDEASMITGVAIEVDGGRCVYARAWRAPRKASAAAIHEYVVGDSLAASGAGETSARPRDETPCHSPHSRRRSSLAGFLGWALDAFDFFILVFTLPAIAKEFGVKVPDVAYAIFLTLAMRFIGAYIFGRLADRFGRKPLLMLDIVSFSVLGPAAAFAPTLTVFLVLRAVFGVAMGGEWGLGSSLTMESIPPKSRGLVSGILQCGYPTGFLLASIVFGIFYDETFFGVTLGWRAMFLFSLLPARWCCSSARTCPNPRRLPPRRRSPSRDSSRRWAPTGACRCSRSC